MLNERFCGVFKNRVCKKVRKQSHKRKKEVLHNYTILHSGQHNTLFSFVVMFGECYRAQAVPGFVLLLFSGKEMRTEERNHHNYPDNRI